MKPIKLRNMKTGKIMLFSLSLCLIILPGLENAEAQVVDKTYKWNYRVDADSRVILANYDTDMQIHTWDKPEIEFHMIINAEFRNREDASEFDAYIGDLDFESTARRTYINSKFWKSRNNIMGISTMVLEGLNTMRYKKFSMECIAWIPRNASLELDSKYSEINMDDIGGELKMDLYNDDIYGGSVAAGTSITAKYSDISFTGMKDLDADLYDCELSTGDAGDLKIVSKYSELETGNAGILDIDSYDDEFDLGDCGDIKFIAKYSEFTAGQAGHLVADNYECEFNADGIKDARIEAKYSEYDFEKAGNIEIISLYEGGMISATALSVVIQETKYAEYKIGELTDYLDIKSAYEDDISVDRLGREFRKLQVDGKYLNIDLGVAFNMDCRLKAKIKYAGLDIDDDVFRTKIHIKDGSDLEYEGIKGTEKAGMPEINISGYEVDLKVSEY